MKKRVNISIGEKLHEDAVAYAQRQEMDFSELLSTLLRERLESERKEMLSRPTALSRSKPPRR